MPFIKHLSILIGGSPQSRTTQSRTTQSRTGAFAQDDEGYMEDSEYFIPDSSTFTRMITLLEADVAE